MGTMQPYSRDSLVGPPKVGGGREGWQWGWTEMQLCQWRGAAACYRSTGSPQAGPEGQWWRERGTFGRFAFGLAMWACASIHGSPPDMRAFPTGREEQVPLPSQDVSFLTRRAHLALLSWHPHRPVPAVSSISAWQTLGPMQARGPWDARLP